MPVSKYYKPLSANVKIPDENDPALVTNTPQGMNIEFGASAEPSSVLGGMSSADLRKGFLELFKGKQSAPQIADGYEPLEMNYGSIPQMPAPLKAKPADTYGTNRGGTGSAGRKTTETQLGKSQFDVGPQFIPPENDMSIADLRKLDDKPWELDENTNADVASGTSFEPQRDNITDRQPDLNSPAGLYEALSKKYPDLLTKNLDQLEQSRVSLEDVDALRDRAGLGSLFIAASKAASAAGSVGGKQPESIAEKIVSREDTLARQNLKDRMDVSSENMAQTAKALDLAVKQINFADEREQYDPNSEVSRFARDFMRSEFKVNVPDDVPAYQLKQFLPAMVQKYSADERARYQAALLGYRETPEQAATRRATEAKAERDFKAEESKLERKLRKDIADERLKKGGTKAAGKVPETPQQKLQGKLVEKDAEKYINRLSSIDKLEATLKLWDEAQNEEQKVQIGQSVIKLLNDPENSDAVGAEEVKRLADELQPYSLMTAKGYPRIGRDLPAFRQKVDLLRQRLVQTAKGQFDRINAQSPDLVPPPKGAGDAMKSERQRRIDQLRQELGK